MDYIRTMPNLSANEINRRALETGNWMNKQFPGQNHVQKAQEHVQRLRNARVIPPVSVQPTRKHWPKVQTGHRRKNRKSTRKNRKSARKNHRN
jgi:hypothetical protein